MTNKKNKFFLIFLSLIFIIFLIIIKSYFSFAENPIYSFSESNKENILIYQKNDKIFAFEFFFQNENEKKIAYYYVNEYIIQLLIKSKYNKIEWDKNLKLPIITFEDLTPKDLSYKIIKELDFKIIDYGDLNKNFQLLFIFSKQFNENFMLRLVEFKIFNKDYKSPIFISGGVHLKINNDMIEIINEY